MYIAYGVASLLRNRNLSVKPEYIVCTFHWTKAIYRKSSDIRIYRSFRAMQIFIAKLVFPASWVLLRY